VDYGYRPHVTVPCQVDGVAYRGDNVKYAWRFFPPVLAREFEPFAFPRDKPPDTCRIFVLGASAAQGVPNHAFCFGRFLQVMLEERFSALDFEVITAAMAAINSHVVREIARDCARYDPDLFVVYVGNNEVVGPYGPGTVLTPALSNLHLIRWGIALRRTRVGQLLSGVIRAAGSTGSRPGYWRGMEMFLRHQVRADDPQLEIVYDHFRCNLEDICRVAAEAGAQTILCTVGSNLGDSPPFASLHRPKLTDQEKERWQEVYDRGVAFETRGDYDQAIRCYLDAGEIDDSYADLQYRLGRCYERSGEYEAARARYVRARDLDVLRFRVDTQINATIREVAEGGSESGVHLADVVRALEAAAPNGICGEEFFHEHVHLTFQGNYLVARTVLDPVESVLQGRTDQVLPRAEVPTAERCAQRLVWSDWSDHQTLDAVVNMYLVEPPFTNQLYHETRLASLERRLRTLKKRLTEESSRQICEEYVAAIRDAPADWRLHWDYGKLLAEDLKQYDAAAAQYRVVQTLLPHSHMGHDALASVLRARGDLDGAVAEYQKVLAIKPTFGAAQYHLGWCYQQQGKNDAAVRQYRQAIRVAPNYVPAYLNLGELLFRRDELAGAAEVCRAGLAAAPSHPLLHCNLGMLLIKMGQRREGAEQIAKALELDPNSARIRRVAETLLGPAGGRR
jgi:tetratricopeptide (TPR) repeat protein